MKGGVTRSRRVFVLGIDGAPHSLLVRFAREGIMPRLAERMTDANSCQMDSVLPTVSSVAWACFLTGKNPGKFDVFGFAEARKDLGLRLPNARDLRGETLPEIVSRAGRRVICLGVPNSFPPRPVNGLLCGCFLAPSLTHAVYPPGRTDELARLGYQLDIDPVRARMDGAYLRPALREAFEGRRRTVEALFDAEPWDLFVLHVMETDRLSHFLWRQWEQGQGDAKAYFEGFYRKVDELIGWLGERLGADDTLVLMSDHGFCSIQAEVQLNRWLMAEGFLRLGGDLSRMFGAVAAGSKAFGLVPGRVHVLREGRYDRGGVREAEYEPLRRELMAKLRAWRDPTTGRTLCKEVLTREEAYQGPYAEHGPDLVIDPADGFDFKAALVPGGLFDHSPLTGMHTRHDAFFLAAGQRLTPHRRTVIDTTRTILDLLGVDAPSDLDSRGMLA